MTLTPLVNPQPANWVIKGRSDTIAAGTYIKRHKDGSLGTTTHLSNATRWMSEREAQCAYDSFILSVRTRWFITPVPKRSDEDEDT